MNRHIQQVPKYMAAKLTTIAGTNGQPWRSASGNTASVSVIDSHNTSTPGAMQASRIRFAPMNSRILRMGRTV